MSFWKSTTDEQKLIQIDAAIELGMTCKQCAMCLRVPKTTIFSFAHRHGRNFNGGMTLAQKENIRRGVSIAQRRRRGADETWNREAFTIFTPPKPERLFNPHPNDD